MVPGLVTHRMSPIGPRGSGAVIFGWTSDFRYFLLFFFLLVLGWGLYVFGIMIVTVAVNSYLFARCIPGG